MSTSCTPNRLLMLRRVCDTALKIQSKCTPQRALAPPPSRPETPPALDFNSIFPYPTPLTPELEALGVDTNTALEISTAYVSTASRFKCLCEALLRESYYESGPSIPQSQPNIVPRLNSVFSERYQSALQQWKEVALRIPRSGSRDTAPSPPPNKARQTFNQDSVPLLEKYFEYNAYPSAADRAVLARKAGLSFRQVEVWFQNHRNRAKKAGKQVKRLRYDEIPYDFSLKGLEEKVPSLRKRRREQSPQAHQTTPTPEPWVTKLQTVPLSHPIRPRESVLDMVNPPPHAFPTPFPQQEDTNPSSLCQPLRNQPEWYRRPAQKLVRHKTPTVDELCESFQVCLNLRQRNKRSHTEAFVEEETPTSWSPATYTTLPSTRHPALVEMKLQCPPMSQPRQLGGLNPPRPQQHPEPRRYLPMPHTPEPTGFLKYQHLNVNLNEPLPIRQNSPHQLRRRSSASSVDSSVGCSTPISSPSPPVAVISSLPDVSDILQDTLFGGALPGDQDILPFSEKLPSRKRPKPYAFCDLTPPLLQSISQCS